MSDIALLRLVDTDNGLVGDLASARCPGIIFRLELHGDGTLRSLLVTATGEGALSARDVRGAPVGALERALRAAHAGTGGRTGSPGYVSPTLLTSSQPGNVDTHALLAWRSLTADFADRPQPGSAGRSDGPYAGVAACYVAAFERGEARPVAVAASELGLDETAVRNYLTRARQRGLLTSAERGRAGGRLTSKAQALLPVKHP